MPRLSQVEYEAILARQRRRPGAEAQAAASASPQSEAALHEAILAECRRRQWYVIHPRMDLSSTIAIGAPDFIIFTGGGRVVVVEAKRRDGKLRPEQLAAKVWLENLGHVFHVVRSIEEFHGIITG